MSLEVRLKIKCQPDSQPAKSHEVVFLHRSRAKVMIFKIQVGERHEFPCTQPEYGCIGHFSNNHIHFSSYVSGQSNDFQNPGWGEAWDV